MHGMTPEFEEPRIGGGDLVSKEEDEQQGSGEHESRILPSTTHTPPSCFDTRTARHAHLPAKRKKRCVGIRLWSMNFRLCGTNISPNPTMLRQPNPPPSHFPHRPTSSSLTLRTNYDYKELSLKASYVKYHLHFKTYVFFLCT